MPPAPPNFLGMDMDKNYIGLWNVLLAFSVVAIILGCAILAELYPGIWILDTFFGDGRFIITSLVVGGLLLLIGIRGRKD
jgi:hypothetical protein